MKRKLLVVFLLCAMCVVAHAEIRPEVVAGATQGFHAWFGLAGITPGTLSPDAEAAFLSIYATEFRGEILTHEEWTEVAKQLRTKHSYKMAPMTRADFFAITTARNRGTSPALSAYYRDRVTTLRQNIVVPGATVSLRLPDGQRRTVNLSDKLSSVADLETLFSLVELTPSGRTLVASLRDKMRKGELKFLPITDEVRATISLPIHALHVYEILPNEENRHVVYLDFDTELGLLAEHLVHEGTHAVDVENMTSKRKLSMQLLPAWKNAWMKAVQSAASRLQISPALVSELHFNDEERTWVSDAMQNFNAEKQVTIEKAELKSHDSAAKWVDEVEGQSPTFLGYYLAQRQRGESHPKKITTSQIRIRYGIENPSGTCRTRVESAFGVVRNPFTASI